MFICTLYLKKPLSAELLLKLKGFSSTIVFACEFCSNSIWKNLKSPSLKSLQWLWKDFYFQDFPYFSVCLQTNIVNSLQYHVETEVWARRKLRFIP